jgi:hypothetical protein
MKTSYRLTLKATALISLGFCTSISSADTSPKTTTKLPSVVKKAFDARYPKATITGADANKENGLEIYDIEFKHKGLTKEADFAKDGTLLESTLVIELKDIPQDVADAIKKEAGDAIMGRAEKVEVNCSVKDGKITKLAKSELRYAVEISKDGKQAEVTVDPKGKVVEPPQWDAEQPKVDLTKTGLSKKVAPKKEAK